MTDTSAARVLELDEQATPGPWYVMEPSWRYVVASDAGDGCNVSFEPFPHDAELIATYRTAAPELARENIALRTEVEALRGVVRAAWVICRIPADEEVHDTQWGNAWYRLSDALDAVPDEIMRTLVAAAQGGEE